MTAFISGCQNESIGAAGEDNMKISTDRILTTHVGSLPRQPEVLAQVMAREVGETIDKAAFDAKLAAAVREVVHKQVAAGIDSVCDGEQSKISYTFYVRHRLSGIGSTAGADHSAPPQTAAHRDILDHPDFMERLRAQRGGTSWFSAAAVPYCTGPVCYENRTPVDTDIANLEAAVAAERPVEAFMNAASPGVLTKFVPNRFYSDEEKYVEALADALKEEYEAIHAAGFILQIDAPDLGSARHNQYQHLSDDEFLKIAERNIAAVNHATQNIPREAMRLHICWGNYEGPHTHDIPLAKVFDVAVKARPQAILFEAANPRHAHEWEELREKKVPDDLILMPGCIDSTTNFVEHPKLVAQRIENYSRLVGRERVVAGTDCGFATFAAQQNMVVPSIAWAKLSALAEGAKIASDRLWK
jgi:5-methyltetrahydropteroyltriglutamate--homocysteine methyltransferase